MAIHAQMYSENLVSPLMNSPDFVMENGCGSGGGGGGGGGIAQFCQNPLVKQQWRKLEEQMQYRKKSMTLQTQNHDQCSASGFLVSPLKYASNAAINDHIQIPVQFYRSIAAHIEKENAELDQYIKLQNERLKWALEEQLKQHVASLLKRIELKTTILLRQKDEEIIREARKRMELEEFLRKLETENQVWQRVAQENEARVISLSNTLDQMRETAPYCFESNASEDAESCCDMNRDDGATEEKLEENRGATKMAMICVVCNSRKSRLLFLPCRHLCSCKVCEAGLDSCPVCGTGKKASIEALIF